MIYKNDLLNKNSINIISYNYEESNGFSQETAVESLRSKFKEHKFLIAVENQHYEILFANHHTTSNYAAMEEVFVNTTDIITDKDVLNIRKIDLNDRYNFEQLLSLENNRLNNNNKIDNQIENFINKLIESAQSLGIGLNYREHYNTEDDFCNTYPNINHTGVSNIYSNALFINDNEIDYFNQYLLINQQNESIQFVENLEKKIKEEELNIQNRIKEEALIESNKKNEHIQKIIDEYTHYEKQIKRLLEHMTTQPQSICFTFEEINSEIKQAENEIKLLKEKKYLHDKIDESYDEEYMIAERDFKIGYLKELIQHLPEQHKIEEKLLKEFNSDIELIKTLIEYNDYGYLSHYLYHYQEEEFEEQQDEQIFNSEEEWNNYQYTKPRSLKERFESIKLFINNQVSYEDIPSQLKTVFGIQNKSVVEFLNDKIQSSNEVEIAQPELNTTNKKKLSR